MKGDKNKAAGTWSLRTHPQKICGSVEDLGRGLRGQNEYQAGGAVTNQGEVGYRCPLSRHKRLISRTVCFGGFFSERWGRQKKQWMDFSLLWGVHTQARDAYYC